MYLICFDIGKIDLEAEGEKFELTSQLGTSVQYLRSTFNFLLSFLCFHISDYFPTFNQIDVNYFLSKICKRFLGFES